MAFPSSTQTWHTTSYPSISPTRPELSVTGKVILITGGGSGLGPHIARAFATAGSTSIALVGRTVSSLETSAAALRSSFPKVNVLTFVADITDKTAIDAAFAETKEKLGPIDILISNAAYMSSPAMVKDGDVNEWWKAFEVNVKGNFLLTQAFLNNMAEKSTILSLTTAGAHIPAIPSLSSYAASKLAAVKFFDYVAAEYPQVRVVNVHPGILDTAMGGKGREAGMNLPFDDSRLPLWSCFEMHRRKRADLSLEVSLSAHFLVWAASPEAEFLKGRLLWSNWDVPELIARRVEFEGTPKFTVGLHGWP